MDCILATEARRLFEDAVDELRSRWLTLELCGYAGHVDARPLSVITACVETLIDGAVDDPEHRGPFLSQIADQSDRLHALILDLLSLARIESGHELFEFTEVALEPLVTECLERHQTRAEAKRQTLEKSGFSADLTVWADEEAVSQILENLIDNAVKYTSVGGRIDIRCQTDAHQVWFEVSDNGIGIPEQELPRIFERFYRVDKARSRELGGTGLGLSIVKHLVQALHGTVQATSQPGKGTSFRVGLPRAAKPQ